MGLELDVLFPSFTSLYLSLFPGILYLFAAHAPLLRHKPPYVQGAGKPRIVIYNSTSVPTLIQVLRNDLLPGVSAKKETSEFPEVKKKNIATESGPALADC